MDQAVIAYARQIGMEVHISTQINITNIETVKFYALFADTMVMSRELSITQIKKSVLKLKRANQRTFWKFSGNRNFRSWSTLYGSFWEMLFEPSFS